MRTIRVVLALATAACCVVACGGDDKDDSGVSPGCSVDPLACPADQTCWPVDEKGNYGCIPGLASATAGTSCEIHLNMAMCGPGLFCYPTVPGVPGGVCAPFCDHGACAGGATCQMIQLAKTQQTALLGVCTPLGTGGTGGSGGSGGTGGSAGSSTGGSAGG